MILKNGTELIKPTEAQIKLMHKNFLDANGHLVLDFHPSRGRVNPSKQIADPNNYIPLEAKVEYPPFFPISTRQIVHNEDGTSDEYQYYTSKTHDVRNKIDRYTPRNIRVRRSEIITNTEEQFFIIFFCSQVANSVAGEYAAKYNKDYMPWLQVVVAEKEAERALESEETMLKAKEVILKTGTEKTLREVASVMNISGAANLSLPLLKKTLLNECKSLTKVTDPEAGYRLFLNKYDAVSSDKMDISDRVAAVVRKAIDEDVLSYSDTSKSWILNEGGVEEGLLSLNKTQVNSKDAVLLRHLTTNPSDFKRVRLALKGESEPEKPAKSAKSDK